MRTALIAGSTGGIGAGIAEHLLASGYRVALNGRNHDAGLVAERRIRDRYGAASSVFIAADVRDRVDAERLFNKTLDAFGSLDLFVHAPGPGLSGLGIFSTIDPEKFEPLLRGHFLSVLNTCHFAAEIMTRQNAGTIITIASDAGKIATPGECIIGAMKAAVIMFSRTLALELSRFKVRVNCITPSLVKDTPAYDRTMQNEHGRKIFTKAEGRAKLGLPGPDDLAALVAFLASPAAARITGQAISVNGGISAA